MLLRYLDTVIHFSYVLLRMLERHSKENAHNMVIRRLKRGGKKKQVRRGTSSFLALSYDANAIAKSHC